MKKLQRLALNRESFKRATKKSIGSFNTQNLNFTQEYFKILHKTRKY